MPKISVNTFAEEMTMMKIDSRGKTFTFFFHHAANHEIFGLGGLLCKLSNLFLIFFVDFRLYRVDSVSNEADTVELALIAFSLYFLSFLAKFSLDSLIVLTRVRI
jgi:hypothetical protein